MGWLRPIESHGVEVIGWREFVSLLGVSTRKQVAYVSGLARYHLLRLANGSTGGRASALPEPPATDWVLAARRIAATKLVDARWLWHSERTWLFATALARYDEVELDQELLYVASLLHDTGLLMDDRRTCFALAGAQFAITSAQEAGVEQRRAEAVSQAISSHISLAPDNQLGEYLQLGSLLDLTGSRVWDLDAAVLNRVCDAYSRVGFPAEVRRAWAGECSKFPNGRAAFARCPGGLTLATRLAPLPR